MKNISLKEMQQIELNLLLEFDKVCKNNNLTYYIDGGTLLGAMCYEGFIPWDDDIDLKMPRADYEKLCSLVSEFPQYIDLIIPSKEHSDYTMIKLVDNRTVLKERVGETVKTTGVYLDIFPMDGHPDDEKECKKHLRSLQRLNTLFHYSLNGFTDMRQSKSLTTRVKGTIYSWFFTPWRIYQRLNNKARKYEYENCEYVGLLIEGDPIKERFRKEWLKPGFSLEFEGYQFPAPIGYKEHMEIFYGEHVTKPDCYHNLPQYPPQHDHEVYWKE